MQMHCSIDYRVWGEPAQTRQTRTESESEKEQVPSKEEGKDKQASCPLGSDAVVYENYGRMCAPLFATMTPGQNFMPRALQLTKQTRDKT